MSKSKSKSKSKSPLMSETELQDLYEQALDMENLLQINKLPGANSLPFILEVPKNKIDVEIDKMRKKYEKLEQDETKILERQKDYQLFKKAEILVKEKKNYDKKIQDNLIELEKIRAEKKKIKEIFKTNRVELKPPVFPTVPVKTKKAKGELLKKTKTTKRIKKTKRTKRTKRIKRTKK
tara:strand:+ start:3223 stop:3759 length:537 start_codon:yes stop_codon:yes gene_type:complete